MSLLLLGYASFVYFVDQNGYKIQCHAKNHIAFWNDTKSNDEYDPYQLRGQDAHDCGQVVINSNDIDERFTGNDGLINTLKTDCKRMKEIIKQEKHDVILVHHCKASGHKTIIQDGETVVCKVCST